MSEPRWTAEDVAPKVLKFRSKSGLTEVARRGDGTISVRVLHGADELDQEDADKLAAALADAGRLLRNGELVDLHTRVFDAESALAELVRLKDGPRGSAYEREKPLAWARARAVLGQHPSGLPVQPEEPKP